MSLIADGKTLAPSVLETTPDNQADTFRNQHRVWPVRRIARGAVERPLPPHARALGDLSFDVAGERLDIDGFMARHRTAGLLILKDGEIAFEAYGQGNVAESLWACFSVTKSITGSLVAAALQDGTIASLDDAGEIYEPRLNASAYAGVTIRNLLRMCSGVAWNEGVDPAASSDVQRLGRAMARRSQGAVFDLVCASPRAHPQGTVFKYSTADSFVLAAVVAAATRQALADYCAKRIWGPAGMEADGHWQLEAENGLEHGGFGISARLRDLGRFGLCMLEDGAPNNCARVWPPGWRDLARQPDCDATAYGRLAPGDPGGYGYHWWATPPAPGIHAGVFSANGAFGQIIFINPGERLVVVLQSAWRQAQNPAASRDIVALIRAAVRALR